VPPWVNTIVPVAQGQQHDLRSLHVDEPGPLGCFASGTGTTDTAELLGGGKTDAADAETDLRSGDTADNAIRVGANHASNRRNCRWIAPTTFWSSSASNGEHEAARCWSRGHALHWGVVGDWPTTSRQPGGGQEAQTEAAQHVMSATIGHGHGHGHGHDHGHGRVKLDKTSLPFTRGRHRYSTPVSVRSWSTGTATRCMQRRARCPHSAARAGRAPRRPLAIVFGEHGERGVGQRCFKIGSLRNRQGGPARGSTPARNCVIMISPSSTGGARRAA
jgi:hypothetical protein